MANVKESPAKATKKTESSNGSELSKEEIIKRRVEVTNFYKENIKHLKVQLEYEHLLTDIDEVRAKRLQAQMFLAQAYQNSDEESQDQNENNPAEDFEMATNPARKLKRQ